MPTTTAAEDHAAAIQKLKAYLETKRSILTSGEMFNTLTRVLAHDIWKLNASKEHKSETPRLPATPR
jgi:hypothetical protein